LVLPLFAYLPSAIFNANLIKPLTKKKFVSDSAEERLVSKYCTAVYQMAVSKIIQQLQSINQSLAGHAEKMDG
jgi:hypothetical protein